MRIVLLSWRDRTHPDAGGSEVYVEELAAGLTRRGHQVTVVVPKHALLRKPTTRDGFRLLPRGGRLTVYLWALGYLLTPAGRRADVVVDVINGLPFWSPLVRRGPVVAVVHHLHRAQWRLIYPGAGGRVGWWVESQLVPRLYRRAVTVTVSESTKADLVDLGLAADRIVVIRNGTPASPEPASARSTTPRICVLSRLVPHKRVEEVIDVVAALRADFPDLALDVLGDGWWASEVVRHVEVSGVATRVHLHGWVDEQRKADLLAQAWLMLLPSLREGWGIAILEAAAHGTPTVARREAGGTTESVLDGLTGRLVSGPDEMVQVVRALLRDPAERERLGANAVRYAAGFDWDTTVREFAELLDERVTGRR